MISYHSNRPQGRFDGARYAQDWRGLRTSRVELIAEVMEYGAHSPVLWAGGVRSEVAFQSAAWCFLDYDEPTTTLAEAIDNKFCDMIHIIGTTKSHRKEKKGVTCDRFRVALLFDRVIDDPWDFRASMSSAIKHYESDAQCIDAARFYWPCTEIVSINSDLECYRQEVVEGVEPVKIDVKDIAELNGQPLTPFVKRIHWFGAPENKRNKLSFMAALEMVRKGYSDDEIFGYIYAKTPTAPTFSDREKKSIIRSARARSGKAPLHGCVY